MVIPGLLPADYYNPDELSELHQLEDAVAQLAARGWQFLDPRRVTPQPRPQLYRRRRATRSGTLRQHDQQPVPGRSDLLPASLQHGPLVGRMDAQAEEPRPALSFRPVRTSRRSPTSRSCSTSTATATPSVQSKAGDYFDKDLFEYDYEPGSGELIVSRRRATRWRPRRPCRRVRAASAANTGRSRCRRRWSRAISPRRSRGRSWRRSPCRARTGYPARASSTSWSMRPPTSPKSSADSPYYAGTIAFFGPTMPGMRMSTDATFAVPLPKTLQAFTALDATKNATLNVRVVPSQRTGRAGAEAQGPGGGQVVGRCGLRQRRSLCWRSWRGMEMPHHPAT